MPPEPFRDGTLIGVDWGTSRLRAWLFDGAGQPIAEASSDDGIGRLDGGHEAVFERVAAGWPAVPAIMAGMVGSRQGWREVPYVPCPTTVTGIAAGMTQFATARGRTVTIVPVRRCRTATAMPSAARKRRSASPAPNLILRHRHPARHAFQMGARRQRHDHQFPVVPQRRTVRALVADIAPAALGARRRQRSFRLASVRSGDHATAVEERPFLGRCSRCGCANSSAAWIRRIISPTSRGS